MTKHFKAEEFLCPCCQQETMDRGFVEALEAARVLANIPFRVTSGWRCAVYQAHLKQSGYETAHGTSPHEKGLACDILINSDKDRYIILTSLMKGGFNRFGIGSNFIHADKDRGRNSHRIWYYRR